MTPKVAVTCRKDRLGVEPYLDAVSGMALEAVPVPAGSGEPVEDFDGLILTGGADVNPARYGQQPHSETGEPDDTRDQLEAALLQRALAFDLPVLAICRGLQLFNVVHGGTLIQHLANAADHRRRGEACVHLVHLVPGTKLAAIVGQDAFCVNSRHHQAADRIGAGLVVSARAPDGVVEGLERPDKTFAIAVQWHPEDRLRLEACDRRLFEAFAEAVRRRAGG
jgi:putative glutamine amidotransferase